MVVNRRISVSTAPPVSRTASTQQAVRAVPPPIPGVHDQPNDTKKERRRSKATKPKGKRILSYSGTFQVLLFSLSAFLVYATAICRIDLTQTLPLCGSSEFYRTQIINPYVLPPVASVIQIAESYAAPLKPYTASTVDFAQTRIIPHISAFVGSSISRYDAVVGPRLRWFIVDQLWDSIIKPSYFDVLHPTLKRHVHPLYNNYLAPGVREGIAYAQVAYIRFLPHAQHYLRNAKKNAARIYKTVRPHVVNLYIRLRPHAIVFLDQVYMLSTNLAQKAGNLRRTFIDPHVRKIVDKVAENRVIFHKDFPNDG